MKLALALLLVASQLNVLVQSQEKDLSCKDNDVFQAVDTALTTYNTQRSSGSQYVLYRITGASLTNSDEQIFAITYEVREGDCTIQTGKNWKDCGYKKSENQEQGKCAAKVKSENGKTFIVIEQNCNIAPVHEAVVAARGPCHGCFNSISTNSSDLEEILKHAVQHFNEKSNHEHIFALKEVLRASRQVVNGWNYKFQYSIIQTDCLKETDQLNSECQPKPQGEIRICSDSAYEDAHMNISITSQTCNLENELNSSISPELREPLKHSLEKINSETKSNFYFKTLRILKAEPLVGSGTGHTIEFYIKETECSKEKEKYSEYCGFNEFGNVLKCTANVLEEEGTFKPTVLCEEPVQVLMKRPPGFSPFRSSLVELPLESGVPGEPQASDITEQEEEQATGTGQGLTPRGYGRGHRKGQTHPGLGLGHKHGHGHGQGHKYKHGQGHWKHEQKDKESHGSWTNEYLDSPNEGNFPSTNQEVTQGPPPLHSPSPQGDAVTSSYFSDFDLLGPNPTNPPAEPSTQEEKTGKEDDIEDDDLIPDIIVEPKSSLFPSLPDLPEPKCPGQPWKPVEVTDQGTEEREDDVFNLSDAI
ncbi:kininogen-1 isoform X1 [Sarcophilus harrisii]|uniref:Kininogen 1 n=1 Tax=Sarcophilus harrisii TaxID=9305 RepID=G3VLV3_SARHA|nr:kininogen-1 isoform X1 [Sarcophilus harrisii]